MKNFKIKSYCKINLSLRVQRKFGGKNHKISSVITSCNIYDLISLSKITGEKDKIFFQGRFSKGINSKSNTITKALKELRKRNYIQNQVFKIIVKKNIPQGAGLGGGSSNAASILNFLNHNMRLKIKKIGMNEIAKKVGFDVPISLEKKNTFFTAKNNKIKRLKKKFSLNILIVYPNITCSTKKIYSLNKNFSKLSSSFFYLKKKSLINFLKNEKNDLENTVIDIYPNVKKLINFIKGQNGCYFSRITGSGAACIGIFANKKSAVLAKKSINLKFPKYWSVVSKTI